jgi:hypothetical protein
MSSKAIYSLAYMYVNFATKDFSEGHYPPAVRRGRATPCLLQWRSFAKVAGKRSYAFVEKGARMSPL